MLAVWLMLTLIGRNPTFAPLCCRPCEKLRPLLSADKAADQFQTLTAAWSGETVALLQRTENEGMDFAAHNVRCAAASINYLQSCKSGKAVLNPVVSDQSI